MIITFLCLSICLLIYCLLLASSPRLQFRGEIDPGSDDFWNKEVYRREGKEQKSVALEIEEEKTEYLREDANAILERLYRAGEDIPPSFT